MRAPEWVAGETLDGVATRTVWARDWTGEQVIIPAGAAVTVTEGRRGWVIHPTGVAGVRSSAAYTWAQLIARVDVP